MTVFLSCTISDGCYKDSSRPGSTPADSVKSSERKPTIDNGSAAIESLLRAYFTASKDQRFKYVIDGERLKARMAERYKASQSMVLTVAIDDLKYLSDSSATVRVHLTGKESAEGPETTESDDFYVRRKQGVWLVDWESTMGMNPMTLKLFRATTPREPITLRIIAELGSYYNFEYRNAQDSHYSIRFTDGSSSDITGYVAKASQLGKELFDILKDGDTHAITVSVQCRGRESGIVDILELVSKTWFIDSKEL